MSLNLQFIRSTLDHQPTSFTWLRSKGEEFFAWTTKGENDVDITETPCEKTPEGLDGYLVAFQDGQNNLYVVEDKAPTAGDKDAKGTWNKNTLDFSVLKQVGGLVPTADRPFKDTSIAAIKDKVLASDTINAMYALPTLVTHIRQLAEHKKSRLSDTSSWPVLANLAAIFSAFDEGSFPTAKEYTTFAKFFEGDKITTVAAAIDALIDQVKDEFAFAGPEGVKSAPTDPLFTIRGLDDKSASKSSKAIVTKFVIGENTQLALSACVHNIPTTTLNTPEYIAISFGAESKGSLTGLDANAQLFDGQTEYAAKVLIAKDGEDSKIYVKNGKSWYVTEKDGEETVYKLAESDKLPPAEIGKAGSTVILEKFNDKRAKYPPKKDYDMLAAIIIAVCLVAVAIAVFFVHRASQKEAEQVQV